MSPNAVPDEHTLYASPNKSVFTLLRENPYVLGLAAVGLVPFYPYAEHKSLVLIECGPNPVCISRRLSVWLRPRGRLGSVDHGIIWCKVPSYLFG